MKKLCSIMVLLLSGILLSGCSGRKESAEIPWRGIQAGMDDLSSITDRVEYYDITVESETIFQWGQEKEDSPRTDKSNSLIGMQFYQGEPVQLWTVNAIRGEIIFQDLYLYRSDGSREVLMQGVDPHCRFAYLDKEGNLYLWQKSGISMYDDGGTEKIAPFLRKYDPSGELIFEQQYDYGYDIEEIRQTQKGRMYLIVRDKAAESRRLAELDASTGRITELGTGKLADNELSTLHLGIYGNKPAAYKFQISGSEITEINVGDGTESCFFSFKGTSYIPPASFELQDFRILEDGSVDILWAAGDGSKGLREELRMEKVEKIPIVLRGVNIEGWIATQINSFNQRSETYHVIVEDCGYGNDTEDFARLTSVQIASGKGPDILYGGLMKDYIFGLMEKGFLEDLRPYMERSGIREEDYFPYTFSTWRDDERICSISPASPNLIGHCMESAVLGGMQEPDIETLADVLLARQEDTVFLERYDSQELLEFLLKGTDSLWGMVDWEKGSCDFGGELFAKLLETAKRYGDRKDSGEVSYIAGSRSLSSIYIFDDRAEREKNGKTICGELFDDGCHVAVTSDQVLAVNTNSPNKEGAWEFLSFLLGDEVQSSIRNVPASRKAYDAWVEKEKARFAGGKKVSVTYANRLADGSLVTTGDVTYTAADVTEEIIEEYTEMLEDARTYPLRNVPILDIIGEEAADYFNGSKSTAEVAKLVTNRVQTYLNEGK